MESPAHWQYLTACIALAGGEDLPRTWAFLVGQGLVRDDDRDRQRFERAGWEGYRAPTTWKAAQ